MHVFDPTMIMQNLRSAQWSSYFDLFDLVYCILANEIVIELT
jgi:hypothetical protein